MIKRGKTEGQRNKWIWFALVTLVSSFVWVEQASICIFTREYPTTDSSVFRYIAFGMANGQIPYKDMFDHKGPLLYFINYLGYCIHPEMGVWLMELLSLAVTVWFMLLIAYRVCNNAVLASVAVLLSLGPLKSYFLRGNFVEEYAMPFIAVALYVFITYFQDGFSSKLKIFICGMCGGAVLMLRPNMAVTWLVFPAAILVYELVNHGIQRLPLYTATMAIGVMAVVLPFVIYYAAQGALGDLYEVYIRFNMQYTSSEGTTEAMIAVAKMFFYPIMDIGMVALLVRLFIKQGSFLDWTYLIYMAMSLLSISISGRQYGHYGMILIPLMAYPLGALAALCRKNFLGAVIVAGMAFGILSLWQDPVKYCFTAITRGNREQLDPFVTEVVDFLKENTDEQDRILVLGNRNDIYNESQRLSASRYSYQYPITDVSEEILNDFFEDIEINKPVAIVDCLLFGDFLPIDSYLEENQYCEVFRSDYYVILKQADQK